jgi:large subunit ribosomal protein L9
MKIILLKDVKGIGRAGDVVTTSDGHAANFLIPKKLAVQATPAELARHTAQAERRAKAHTARKAYAVEISKNPLLLTLKTGPNGEVFSSISRDDITAALLKKGYADIRIELEKPIRSIGTHHAIAHLGDGIEATITIKTVGDK